MDGQWMQNTKLYKDNYQRKKRWKKIVSVLACIVVFCTTYALILPAITMEQTAHCGTEEHRHSEACYERQLICGYDTAEENMENMEDEADEMDVDGEAESHTHTEECYEMVLVCGLEEHEHTLACYSNPEADVESASDWERSVSGVSLTGVWADDVIAIAESQIGYRESTKNYQVLEDGETMKGYTRYGEWYGNAYADWSGMFVSFCLNFANVPDAMIPQGADCAEWVNALTYENRYETASDYTPVKGDLVFFDTDGDGRADHAGLVSEISDDGTSIRTIEGDKDDCVQYGSYGTNASVILGYAALPENPEMEPKTEAKLTSTPALLSDDAEDTDDTDDTGSTDGVGNTDNTTSDSTDNSQTQNTLPGTKLSGNKTEYDPSTDTFTTNVRVDFQFTAETGKPTAGTAYTYTYPKGIEVPDDVVNKGAQNLYDGDKLAGTYQFIKNKDGTYSVQVIFNQDYVDGSGDKVTGYVQFEGSFSKEDMNDKGDIVVGGDDATILVPGEEINYPKDETESYDIDVSKSGSWVQDGDKLVYTVYVRTTKGTPNPISFTDTIRADGLTLGEPMVTVEKGTANYSYASWDQTWKPTDNNNWSEVSNIESTYVEGKLKFTLPKLSAEETKDSNNSDYIIGDVYKITYTYPITDQTVASVSPENKVTVTAKDETKGQTVTDSDKTTVKVDKDFSYTLDKSGAVASGKPGYIKWTVTINNNEMDIAGAKLTDEMLGLVEDTAKDIVIYPAEGATVNKNTNGKITDISFTATENGVNKNKYTITYYTPVEESWDGTTVTNKATLDPTPDKTGDEKEATASVTVSGVQLNKQGTFNGATNKIDWTITVNAGNLDIAGATLTDEMFAALSENDFTIAPSTGYSFTKDTDGKITGITFTAVEDGKNTQKYTIKYSTDVTENADGTTSPVTNSATLSPGEGKEGTPIGSESTVTPDEVQLTKSGSYTWDKKISWTITVNASKLNIAGAVLTDKMFSQLTVSDITIQKNGWETPDSSEYTVAVDENGKITSITFHAIGATGVNINQYTITYTTDEPQGWNDKTVHNEAKLTLDGKEIPGTADVTVPGDGSVAKSAGTGEISEDGTTMTIPWTVTLTIPKGGLPAGTTIVDDVTKKDQWNTNTNQWMTRSQITAWATNLTWTDDSGNSVGGTNTYNPPPEQVTFLASNGNTYTYKQINEYKAPAGEEGVNYEALTYTLFTIHFPDGLVPPEGATKLTFTYSTTVDLTKTTTGGNKFYNDIQVGGKENSAEYTYYKPGIVKTDGNGSTDTTTVSNEGTLTWKVKAIVGEGNKKLTLIDTLPEGVTLNSLQLTGWGNLNMELTVDGETISGTDSTNQYTVSGTYTNGVITLDIVPQTEGNTIQTGSEFTLTVNCQVNDAENQTELKTLTNTAKMELDGGEIGSSSQTQEWTYHKEEVVTQVVDKSGGWDNANRIMNYTVVLNPEGKDLVNGADTLTLIDTMTYQNQFTLYHPFSGTYNINAALIQSSVKLYTAVWNEEQGKWVAGEAVTDWSWTYEAKTGENDWDRNNATNTITAAGIPDGTPLMLQYSYRVTCNVPDEINGQKTYFNLSFKNTAKLEGTDYSGEHSSSDTKWEHSSESAGVTTDKSYTFYKVEAGNYNVSLAGATFSVYQYDTSTGAYGTEPVKTYSTNASGSFHITRQEKDASGNVTFSYATNTLYKVTETAPPNGYKLPDEVKTFYFYFSSTEDTAHTLPENLPADAVDLTNEARTVYVENVKNTTEITVEKKWQDKNGKPVEHNSGSVTINLYQKTSQGSSSGGGSGDNVTVTISVMKNDTYNSTVSACTLENEFQCRSGSTLTITVNTWGTPSLYANGDALEYSSTSSGDYGSTNYIYQVAISENTTITGYAMNDNDGSVTYSCDGILANSNEEESISSYENTEDKEDVEVTEYEMEGVLYKTITLNNSTDWKHTFTNLPLTGTDAEGNPITYYYYIEEVSVLNYETTYENNGGIQSGTITVTNRAQENPVMILPETGGSGTTTYIMGGILLMLASILLYIKQYLKEGRGKHIQR